jgi:hypothetical protein
LDPKGIQTFEGGKKLKEVRVFVKVEMEMCIIKYTMGITRNNELEFQRLP